MTFQEAFNQAQEKLRKIKEREKSFIEEHGDYTECINELSEGSLPVDDYLEWLDILQSKYIQAFRCDLYQKKDPNHANKINAEINRIAEETGKHIEEYKQKHKAWLQKNGLSEPEPEAAPKTTYKTRTAYPMDIQIKAISQIFTPTYLIDKKGKLYRATALQVEYETDLYANATEYVENSTEEQPKNITTSSYTDNAEAILEYMAWSLGGYLSGMNKEEVYGETAYPRYTFCVTYASEHQGMTTKMRKDDYNRYFADRTINVPQRIIERADIGELYPNEYSPYDVQKYGSIEKITEKQKEIMEQPTM